MADESNFYGTWKIVECVSLAGTVESTGIEGTVFTLDESGDVSWKVCEDAEPMPFFSCETYEVILGDPAVLHFFGSFAGHIIEFKVEISDDLMLLTYERCCMLQCQKISTYDPKDEVPFCFLNALDEGYFTDMCLRANTAKEFPAHTTVLQLAVPEIDWQRSPPPLCGQSEDVITTVLHYAYAECLPKGLSEEAARDCIKATEKLKGFKPFVKLCTAFLKNTALKHQIESLVEDMHACADRIIELFSDKTTAAATGTGSGGGGETTLLCDQSLVNNPAKLCYVFKQALREASVAAAKLLILCDLFSRRKGELSREERHNIIKYTKSRLPVFLTQLERFFEVCTDHYGRLTAAQRHDLATYLVPEIEHVMESMSTLTAEVKSALEHVISISSEEKTEQHKSKHGGQVAEVLGKSLKEALHMREMLKLRSIHEKISRSFLNFMQQKEQFGTLSADEKVRSVSKTMEQLIDENIKLPAYLTKIRELRDHLDEKVTWRMWKYSFKLGTSKVAWILNKFQAHKATVTPLITKLCDMIHRDQFNQSLVTVGLLEVRRNSSTIPSSPTSSPSSSLSSSSQAATSSSSCSSSMQASEASTSQLSPSNNTLSTAAAATPIYTNYVQLSAIESLCEPPFARDSELARKALDLLHCAENTDMVFEIVVLLGAGDIVIDHMACGGVAPVADHQQEVEIHTLPVHRVIIASRCDWFRRALLSGMREAIDKKIIVHDTSPAIFKLLIEYLYSGQLDMDNLSTEQLSDLLALTDRYEVDSLKSECEFSLKHHIDEDSCLFLLNLADQYNAANLRSSTLNFIMEHPGVMESDVYEDLPAPLQAEVENVVSWQSPDLRNLAGHSHTETPSSTSSEVDLQLGVTDRLRSLHMRSRGSPHGSSSSSDGSADDLQQYIADADRLSVCVSELRDIVGEDYPHSELQQVALAADCDTNRALNYIFSAAGTV